MKKSVLSFALLLISYAHIQAQRLPYPIIFVHGWVGSDRTWMGMGAFLKKNGLNVSLRVDVDTPIGGDGSVIDFHLNADGNNATAILNRAGGPYLYGDVYDYNSVINPENDIFFVNFENEKLPNSPIIYEYSNQAAAVKQGFAVGLAVKKVLNATKAKKVILVGHSMGGLAIREYLQNSENWLMGDGESHVAKLVTIGTPHGGSNSNSGNIISVVGSNERSEAVRDLRYPAIFTSSDIDRGVYLFGGDERSIVRLGLYGLQYFNDNVNCDNSLGEIQGLNQKTLPSLVPYTCVIGTGSKIANLLNIDSDGVVEASRALLFNYSRSPKNDSWDDVFYIKADQEESGASQYYSKNDKGLVGTWHGKLTKQVLINTAAMDEPSHGSVAYSIDLNKSYTGFLTKRPDGTRFDSDLFKIFVEKPGVLTVNLSAEASANAQVVLYDQNWFGSALAADKSQVKLNIPKQGTYYVEIKGNNWSGDIVRKYSFSTSFCSLDLPYFSVSGPVTFCQGKEVILSAESYYDSYRWYKDGQPIPSNSPQLTVGQNQLTVNQTGKYTLEAQKCGVWLKPDNRLDVTVKPLPPKPAISKQEQPDKFLLTSSSPDGNQWFLNGKQLSGATSKTHIPQELGAYTVAVTQSDCSSSSEAITIKMDKPLITYSGPTSFFEGDSLVLSGTAGFSQYHWMLNENPLPMAQLIIAAKKSGSYKLATQRGIFKSEFSDPVTVTVIPILGVDPQKDLSLMVFPNPNNGVFSLELPDELREWQIDIMDAQGKPVIHQKQGKQIEIKSPAGTYFLRIRDAKIHQTVKFQLY